LSSFETPVNFVPKAWHRREQRRLQLLAILSQLCRVSGVEADLDARCDSPIKKALLKAVGQGHVAYV
jgi:hypothetical protein